MDITEEHYKALLNLTYNYSKHHGTDYMDVAHDLICEGYISIEDAKKAIRRRNDACNIEKSGGIIYVEELEGIESLPRRMVIYKYCYKCHQVLPDYLFRDTVGNNCLSCKNEKNVPIAKASMKKSRGELKDGYIKDILKKTGVKEITKELIESKRKEILKKRAKKARKLSGKAIILLETN